MKKILLISILLFSCSNNANVKAPQIKQRNFCELSINDKAFKTALKQECAWALGDNNKLKLRIVNNEQIAILLGQKISKEQALEWGVKDHAHCSFSSIAVKFDNSNTIITTSSPMKDLLLCSDTHIDKKVFWSYRWE